MGKPIPGSTVVDHVVTKTIGIFLNQSVDVQVIQTLKTPAGDKNVLVPARKVITTITITFELYDVDNILIPYVTGPENFQISVTDAPVDEKQLLALINLNDLVAQVKAKWSGEVF